MENSTQELGRNLSAPKRVFVTSESVGVLDESLAYGEKLFAEQGYLAKDLVSIRKSFKVRAEIADHVKITGQVTGIYQIE